MEDDSTTLSVTAASGAGQRLDKYLADQLNELSRSRIQTLIKGGDITVNGRPAKPRQSLNAGDRIDISIPPPEDIEAQPQDIPLDVLYEDDHLLVIDKPAGLVVHPAAGNPDGTLVNAVLHHCQGRLSGIGGALRPGIVHRLDKDTSGCIAVAKDDLTHQRLTAMFSSRALEKIYLCVVQGVPGPPHGRIENRIGRHPVNRQKMAVLPAPAGKEAITDYRVLHTPPDGSSAWSLVECQLHTGRTHQIRVHMKEIGHPILGDPIYSHPSRQPVQVDRLLLHAHRLAFTHPITKKPLKFRSEIPAAFHPFLPPGFETTG